MPQCPSTKVLDQYIRGDLSDDQRARIDAHIQHCDKCRQLSADPADTELLNDLRHVFHRQTATPPSIWVPPEDLQGQCVGVYCIDRLLGEGGMARVYRAINTETETPVAFKVLKPQYQVDNNVCARFEREARSMARIKHDHVIRILDFTSDAGVKAIVMELLTGGSLRRRLNKMQAEKQTMDITEAVDLITQAAQGIHAAHQMDMVHRDVKPSNLMLNKNGQIKVADFGAIQVFEGTTWLTGVGQQIGTPNYMSPEQCRGDRVTPASDVYSLGATLYELVAGRLPFEVEEASPFAIMLKHISEPPPDPRVWREDLPDWLAMIILKCLEKKSHNRYQNAGQLAEALLIGPPAVPPEMEPAIFKEAGLHMDISAIRKQLQKLSHRAIIFWACRCARQVQYLNPDPRLERALSMAEAAVSESAKKGSQHAVSQALSRIHAIRAASLRAAYADDTRATASASESAKSAAAASACATARCIDDAAADAAFAARSAITALKSANEPIEHFWEQARRDYQVLRQACQGQEGTIGKPLPGDLFEKSVNT